MLATYFLVFFFVLKNLKEVKEKFDKIVNLSAAFLTSCSSQQSEEIEESRFHRFLIAHIAINSYRIIS